MSRAAPQSLDVLRTSPVRGQLEPYDPRTPKGCRYIQTTDTPDELKMLLPPATASMYEQLLNLENYELSKKPNISWERIMEIRHLKDRMCRKCQKLAKTAMPIARTSSRGDSFVFQTFVAPPDFRVKEMEKWFREQQKRGTVTSTPRKTIAPNASGTQDYSLAGPSSSRPVPPPSSRQPMQRSITIPETSNQVKQTLFHKPLPVQPSRLVQSEIRHSTTAPPPPDLAGLLSPPPLPVLLLSQRESYGLEGDGFQSELPLPAPPVEVETGPSPTPPEPTLRPSLSRKNSRRNSLLELKTVSWADNNEIDKQLSKYAAAAREAQASGKWDEVRVLYLEQIGGLESLHLQVKEGLEQLRSETDHLQRIDETIRKQRGALDATFQELEKKQALFQEKVQEALSEANDALSRQGLKRDLTPINES
ncbi:hypothetical protein JR316_0001038 [Psilocybe cubensis]|uniref:Uncharacterized protein n=2 Tax=Psilocybe cubensis TaxID=181762 RepID=A0ACB8HH28_PSICU|nr:hypothetical protein JR316_0001038 [Psilocybe cubensis]KAH9486972.1 hypothetical protein JR316_0001038 [Psilocybe cubensis]